MLRGLSDAILLFLVPFAGYALFLIVWRRYPHRLTAWTREPVLRLIAAGLALAVAGTLMAGLFAARYKGDYVPAHLEKGVLVPGKME